MRRAQIAALIISILLILAGTIYAGAHEASREKGKLLFNDPKLGTTGKSCNDCHPGGKGAERASAKSDQEIARIVNVCITHSIRGAALEPDSEMMQSLVLYIKSFSKENSRPARQKGSSGC